MGKFLSFFEEYLKDVQLVNQKTFPINPIDPTILRSDPVSFKIVQSPECSCDMYLPQAISASHINGSIGFGIRGCIHCQGNDHLAETEMGSLWA